MKPPVSRSPKTDRHSKTGIPACAGSQHLAHLINWFCGLGFDRDEAERKAVLWMKGKTEP